MSFNATLQSSTIEGNWAPLGGGIYTLSAQVQMTNCILSGNSAVEGGGLVSTFDDDLRLLNCTIAGNSATDDAQISCQLGSVPQVKNSIVWEEPSGAVCGEVLHTISREDPLFVKEGVFNRHRFVKVTIGGVVYDLPDFIVDRPDYHLRPGSPAIGAGTPEGAPPEDIEGTGRPCAGGIDAGAYQSGGCEPGVFRRGDTDGSGTLNVTDPIRVLHFLFRGGVPLSCLDAGDVDDSGSLNVTDPIYLLSFLFHGGPPPRSPHPGCGQDETPEGLGCESYEGCD
jgi:hypothetical protein